MGIFHSRKWMAVAVAIVAPFSLVGCLILPGAFTSEMTVRESGDFSFSYQGQIQLVGLSNILNSEMLNEAGKAEFKPYCWGDGGQNIEMSEDADAPMPDTAMFEPVAIYAILRGNERPVAERMTYQSNEDESAQAAVDAAASLGERECTPEEVAEQKKTWDDGQVASKKRDEETKKMAKMLLGGIDPQDPATITRFTREVERMAAWNKVEHVGNGVFMIDYRTSGRLADDFAFPVIPRYAVGEPMIHITRWDNGRVRVEAPAFKTDPALSMMGLFGAGSMFGMMGGGTSTEKMPEPLAIKGSFTLTTDAPILANNTEDGPEDSSGMQVLRWDIGPANYGPPMAMLKIAK